MLQSIRRAFAPASALSRTLTSTGTLRARDINAEPPSLYTQLGGPGVADGAIVAVVDRFYEKLLALPEVKPFFAGIDMAKQKQHQSAFITLAFGGPSRFAGRSMNEAHVRVRNMGITDNHFDLVKYTLAATLAEFKLTDKQIMQAATVVESTREAIMGRAP